MLRALARAARAGTTTGGAKARARPPQIGLRNCRHAKTRPRSTEPRYGLDLLAVNCAMEATNRERTVTTIAKSPAENPRAVSV